MIHENKNEFLNMLEITSAQTNFPLNLLEKDYYITVLLSDINKLDENLVFKGGTCLNKIYYSYYRLSEDLDFSMKMPEGNITRGTRRKVIKPIKENIEEFVKKYGLTIDTEIEPGRNESKQYVFYIYYDSVVLENKQSIKLEIGLRYNPIMPMSKQKVSHVFLHPFTKEPLFESGMINCLCLEELVAEKLRAATTRLIIAPRDFYDLDYLMRAGFDFTNKGFIALFQQKLEEDNFDTDLKKYRVNLGRKDHEIKDMISRIEAELYDVLTLEERKKFEIQNTLKGLNDIFRNV